MAALPLALLLVLTGYGFGALPTAILVDVVVPDRLGLVDGLISGFGGFAILMSFLGTTTPERENTRIDAGVHLALNVTAILIFGVGLGALAVGNHPFTDLAFAELSVLFALFGAAITMSALVAWLTPFAWAMTLWERRHPDVTMTRNLVLALDAIAKWPCSLRERAIATRAVSAASVSLARDLPNALGLAVATDDRAVQRFRLAAGALIDLRADVATVNERTHAEVLERLRSWIVLTSKQSWDQLPESATTVEPDATMQQSPWSRVARFVLGIVPIVALAVVSYSGVDLGGSTGYLTLLAALWAVVSFLGALSPNWARDLAEARETVSAVRGK